LLQYSQEITPLGHAEGKEALLKSYVPCKQAWGTRRCPVGSTDKVASRERRAVK